MDSSVPSPPRPWRIVAREISHTMDPKKVMQLSEELNRALGKQGSGGNSHTEAEKKAA